MAMSKRPSASPWIWKVELGVGVSTTRIAFRSKNPWRSAAQSCKLKPPEKTTTLSVCKVLISSSRGIYCSLTNPLSKSDAHLPDRVRMEFGYFTLSDNHYPNNKSTANQFVLEIREQAILADRLGMHSAWIGEHHFDSLGVNSRPDLVLANVAAQTRNIRLAPAVNVLPLHHPIHVAEAWATLDVLSNGRVDFATGRGYDRKEYAPFGADFMKSAEIFEEGIDVLLKAWNSPGPWSHHGTYYKIPEMSITPKPVQKPLPFYVASFSKTSVDIAAKRGLNIIYAPFAAGMVFGGLDKAVAAYREACEKAGKAPGRAMCSYFIFIA